jgi:vacuolar-type H+-ATPase subunit F/Vma7
MSRIVAIGSELELAGYALAGVDIKGATDPEAARSAWAGLASEVELVLLTRTAADALGDRNLHSGVLSVVLPE